MRDLSRSRRFAALASAFLVIVLLALRPVAADNAPFWESPVGLTPGQPDARVRMRAESVDIQVIERGGGVFAVVDATFSMLKHGPDIRMKVGVPNFTLNLITEPPVGADEPPS